MVQLDGNVPNALNCTQRCIETIAVVQMHSPYKYSYFLSFEKDRCCTSDGSAGTKEFRRSFGTLQLVLSCSRLGSTWNHGGGP